VRKKELEKSRMKEKHEGWVRLTHSETKENEREKIKWTWKRQRDGDVKSA